MCYPGALSLDIGHVVRWHDRELNEALVAIAGTA